MILSSSEEPDGTNSVVKIPLITPEILVPNPSIMFPDPNIFLIKSPNPA